MLLNGESNKSGPFACVREADHRARTEANAYLSGRDAYYLPLLNLTYVPTVFFLLTHGRVRTIFFVHVSGWNCLSRLKAT